ncbi:hypothetical protein C8R46DRAFT_115013, partial [Mycena filopes]
DLLPFTRFWQTSLEARTTTRQQLQASGPGRKSRKSPPVQVVAYSLRPQMPPSRCSQCDFDSTGGSPPPPKELDVASPGTRRHTLVHSNEVPLEAEAAVIEAELAPLDDRILSIDDEILRLRGKLERLAEERLSVSKYRAQHRAILSPLRRMPPEILGHIFSSTLLAPHKALETVVSVEESPWSLSHVSRYWRAVALAESSMWSIVVMDYRDSGSHYPLSMLETQVARAKTLKVYFFGDETSDPAPQIETFRFLAQHAPQWEELSLGLSSHIAPLLSELRDRVPLLRIFSLHSEDEPTVAHVDCFRNAPSLVEACVGRRLCSVTVLFPADRLTGYELQSSWDTHAGILKQTRNLVVAGITVLFGGDDEDSWQDPDSHEIINLTCLQHLFVSHAEILDLLRFPALGEVAINCGDSEGPNILAALRSAVSRSSCVLRRLCFWSLPLLTSTTEILNQFPSIVDFAVLIFTPDDGLLAETLMERLTITADSAVVGPQLRCISFACDDDGLIAHGIYLEMIISRWRAGGCKTSELLLASGPRPDADILRGIEQLREEGLDLVYLEGDDAGDVITTWNFEPQWGRI